MAIEFEKRLNDFGYSTKILPEAMEWHFAGSWGHLLNGYKKYNSIDLESKYKLTGNLLRRSICLNILVSYSEKDCIDLADVIRKIYNQMNLEKVNI